MQLMLFAVGLFAFVAFFGLVLRYTTTLSNKKKQVLVSEESEEQVLSQ